MGNRRAARRATFNSAADLYDKVRPGYPEALIDDVISLSALPEDGRILEIGCATGKATELFARRGYSMVCLDIGADLANVAARKLADLPNVEIVVSSFEDWAPRGAGVGLIIAATSFHWVDPTVAYVKSAEVLEPEGALAVLRNSHVRKDEGFFRRVQDVYRACAPSMASGATASKRGVWQPVGEELFDEPIVRRYPWSVEYSTEQYVDLLATYSDHISLPAAERDALFTSIADLIDREYRGAVLKHYEAVLGLRKKRWLSRSQPEALG